MSTFPRLRSAVADERAEDAHAVHLMVPEQGIRRVAFLPQPRAFVEGVVDPPGDGALAAVPLPVDGDRHHAVEAEHAGNLEGGEIVVVRVGEVVLDAAGAEVGLASSLVDRLEGGIVRDRAVGEREAVGAGNAAAQAAAADHPGGAQELGLGLAWQRGGRRGRRRGGGLRPRRGGRASEGHDEDEQQAKATMSHGRSGSRRNRRGRRLSYSRTGRRVSRDGRFCRITRIARRASRMTRATLRMSGRISTMSAASTAIPVPEASALPTWPPIPSGHRSRMGTRLLYHLAYWEQKTASGLWLMTMPGSRSVPFRNDGFLYPQAALSPDGHWVAYSSNQDQSGRFEIYVESFPTTGRRVQVSTNGGTQPKWRRDPGRSGGGVDDAVRRVSRWPLPRRGRRTARPRSPTGDRRTQCDRRPETDPRALTASSAAGRPRTCGARARLGPAGHQHDNQHQENDPSKTTSHGRAAEVETASAEQQQQDDQ